MTDAWWEAAPVVGGPTSPAAPRRQSRPAYRPAIMPEIKFADDRDALIRTVAGEAGNQPDDGQVAVAAVALNRARNRGMTPTQIVLQRNQFEPWGNPDTARRLLSLGQDDPQYVRAAAAVDRALQGEDPTGGASHFYAPKAQAALGRNKPSWDTGNGRAIGDHLFFTLEGGSPVASPPSSDEGDWWEGAPVVEATGAPQDAPGSSRAAPIDLATVSSADIAKLTKGAWVKNGDEVYALPSDAWLGSPDDSSERVRNGVYIDRPDAGDALKGFATAAVEQIPFADEYVAGAAGLLSGRGYDEIRDEQMQDRQYLNDTQGAARDAGGVAGFAAGLFAPGVATGTRFIQGATGAERLARAGLVGSAGGLLYGSGNTDGNLAERAEAGATGALTGYGAGAIGQRTVDALTSAAARRAAQPATPQRLLSQAGVDLTPGQLLGGLAKRIEDGSTSIPILGDAIRGAQRRGLETFDTAATNAALEPIGVRTASSAGRQGVRDADDAVSAAYRDALDGVTVARDADFDAAISQVRQGARLTPTLRRNLNAVLDDVLSRFDGDAVAGDVWKQVDSELAASIRAADRGAANAPEQRILRDRLQEAREAVGGLLERNNAAAFEGVRRADRASAQYRLVRKASSDVAAAGRGGNASPATLNRAVVSAGGERRAARGESLLQDLTDDAMAVLPQTVPDSGTAFRSLLSVGGLGGGAAAVGANPIAVAGSVGLLGLGAASYSRGAQAVINRIYRASTPGDATKGLAELADLARRDPALVPVYEALALRLLPGSQNQSPTTPQGQAGLLTPMAVP